MDEGYIKLGFIKRVQGLKGEVIAHVDLTLSIAPDQPQRLFLEMAHTLVPYQIVYWHLVHKQATIQFQGVHDRTMAYLLKGKALFIQKEALIEQAPVNGPLLELVDYQVSDVEQGALGIVERIENFPGQKLLVVNYRSQELLIPYHEKLIYHIDPASKHLLLKLPSGFIEAVI